MQAQDSATFFQDLLVFYYQFTLENSVYATCLAISVWLITSIFYSISIAGLNNRNKANLIANQESQNALAAAHLQIQELQTQASNQAQQIEQENQRSLAMKDRISELRSEIAESIMALSAIPELGQPGLSVSDSMQLEQVWQSYSAATKQLSVDIQTLQKQKNQLQAENSAETAKLAERNLQLQAAQSRLDNQKQLFAKLESSIEEYKSALAEQQESAKQRLAEIETKHEVDLARLAELEKQAANWQHKQQQVQHIPPAVAEQLKSQDEFFALEEPESFPEPEIIHITAVPTQHPEFSPSHRDSINEVNGQIPSATVDSTVNNKQEAGTQTETASSNSVGGRFKSLLSGAKQKLDKLDAKLGKSSALPEVDEPVLSYQFEPEPQAIAPEVEEALPQGSSETSMSSNDSELAETKKSSGLLKAIPGLNSKFKNMFGSKATANAIPVETAEPELAVETEMPVAENTSGLGGKFKNIFAAKQTEKIESNQTTAIPAIKDEQESAANTTISKFGGKFKDMFAAKPAIIETRLETEDQIQAAVAPETVSTHAGVAGGFKNLFANAKQKIEKLDSILVPNNPQIPVAEQIPSEEEKTQTKPKKQPAETWVNKFKNPFLAKAEEAPVEVSPPEPEPEPNEMTGNLFTSQFKNLFGKSK